MNICLRLEHKDVHCGFDIVSTLRRYGATKLRDVVARSIPFFNIRLNFVDLYMS